MKKRIVVLISGSGSNLQAIIDACNTAYINGELTAVISNKADAYGLIRAQQNNIPTHNLSHKDFDTREAFDVSLANLINDYSPDLLVLAGFMRILSSDFVTQFKGKMLNIHPSLLPKYPGLHTHKKALENKDKVHGASIHFVTPELDGGPVVIQTQVTVDNTDTVDSLAKKVAVNEWKIYPLVVKWFCDERLHLENDQVWLDKKIIKPSGVLYENMENWQTNLSN